MLATALFRTVLITVEWFCHARGTFITVYAHIRKYKNQLLSAG